MSLGTFLPTFFTTTTPFSMRNLFSACLAAVFIHLAASSAIPSPLQARVAINPEECVQYEKYIGIYDNTLDFSQACASVVRLFVFLNSIPLRIRVLNPILDNLLIYET